MKNISTSLSGLYRTHKLPSFSRMTFLLVLLMLFCSYAGIAQTTNIALGKTATSSSDENANYLPANAVDGNTGTRWSSAFADNQWVRVDLGTVYSINRVKLTWEAAYATNYRIETSLDGTNWTIIASRANATGQAAPLINDLAGLKGSGRYIRMFGLTRATAYGFSLWEFEIYGFINLAFNKAAVSSSNESTSLIAANAFDGKDDPYLTTTGTRWSSAQLTYTDETPQWIYVNLGGSYILKEVKINWEASYASDYQLQVSSDATNWAPIRTITGNTAQINNLTGLTGVGQYVRMYGTKRGNNAYGYSIYELEVDGTPNTAPTVSISSPTNGMVYTVPTTATISANASDAENNLARVEFYSGTDLLGTDVTAPYSVNVNVAIPGTFSLTAKAYDAGGLVTTSAPITIYINPAAPSVTGASRCGTGSVTLSAAGTPAGGTYNWYTVASGGIAIAGATAANYTTPSLSANTTYYVSYTSGGRESTRMPVTATINPVPTAPVASNVSRCGPGDVTLSVSNPSGAYQWYTAAGTAIAGATGSSYTATGLTATTTFYVAAVSSAGCVGPRTAVSASVTGLVVSQTPGTGLISQYMFAGNANDVSGNNNNGTVQGTTNGGPTPAPGRAGFADNAYNFDGVDDYISTTTAYNNPNVFTLALWFKTTVAGGRLIGFGANQTGPSTKWDRHIYMSADGKIYFGVYTESNALVHTVNTVNVGYNDGQWHQVVASLSPAGMKLYIDGGKAVVDPTTTIAENYTGYWKIGYDKLEYAAGPGGLWPGATNKFYYTGLLDDVHIYNKELTTTEIATLRGAGADPICAGSSLTLKANTITNATYSWTGPGNFTSTLQNPVIANASAANAGAYTVTITANGCTSQVTVPATINALSAAPTAAGTAICGSGSVRLTATGSTGVYRWYSAATGGTLLASTADYDTPVLTTTTTYYVAAVSSEGCEGTRTAVTVTVNAIPIAPTAPGVARCGSGTVNLLAGGTPTGGTYRWYDVATSGTALATTATFTTPTLTATTTYYVSAISAQGCEGPRTTVTATINPLPATPTITASGATTFCSGGAVTLTASAIAAGETYLWSNGATTLAITVSATGNYTVQVKNSSNCSATSAATTVTINPTPSAPTAANVERCGSGSTDLIASGAPAGGTYRWYNVATGGTVLATTATYTTHVQTNSTFYVSVVSSAGCEGPRKTVAVTIKPVSISQTPTAGLTTAYFFGGNTTDDSGNGNTGTLQGGATLTTDRYAAANNAYSFDGVDDYISTTTSYAAPGPMVFSISLWFNTTTTTGGKLIGYGALQTGFSTNVDRHIYMSNDGKIYFGVNPGGVQVLSTLASYNDGKWHNVTATLSTAGMKLYVDGVLQAKNANVTGAENFAGYWRIAYDRISTSWPGAPSSLYFKGSLDGIHIYNREITTAEIYTLQGAGVDPVCAGGTLSFKANTITGATYSWTGPNGFTSSALNPTIANASAAHAGTYILSVTTSGGCISQVEVTAAVNPIPTAPTAQGAARCGAGTVTLTASNAPVGGSYNWYNVANGGTSLATTATYSPTLSATTTYYVATVSTEGCESPRTAVTATVNQAATPTVSANGPTSFCAGGSVVLTASAANTYLWSTGATTQSITVNATGNYTVTITDANTCQATSAATAVTVNPVPTAPTVSDVTQCGSGTVSLTASNAPAGGSYRWYDAATNGTLLSSAATYTPTINATTTYYLMLRKLELKSS